MITFQDRYYECGGNEEEEDKGLMIGGYEPAWLADLVAAYILDNTEARFRGTTYRGIYRDEASRGEKRATNQAIVQMYTHIIDATAMGEVHASTHDYLFMCVCVYLFRGLDGVHPSVDSLTRQRAMRKIQALSNLRKE